MGNYVSLSLKKFLNRTVVGGVIENYEYCGVFLEQDLTNVLLIDTRDVNSPIRFSDAVYLPFVFPFMYGNSGAEIVYSIDDELKINVAHVCEYHKEDASSHFNQSHILGRKFKMRPLRYAERRILHSSVRQRSSSDQRLMDKMLNGHCWKISGLLSFTKGCFQFTCTDGEQCSVWNFAELSLNEAVIGDIWHDFSGSTLCFGMCNKCKRIHGYMHSD
jgi:hypothetical protein